MPMARSPARDAEDFARLMLQTIERLSLDGGWVRASKAFEQTLSDHRATPTSPSFGPSRRDGSA
jgi:hypothetical protein